MAGAYLNLKIDTTTSPPTVTEASIHSSHPYFMAVRFNDVHQWVNVVEFKRDSYDLAAKALRKMILSSTQYAWVVPFLRN